MIKFDRNTWKLQLIVRKKYVIFNISDFVAVTV
jgi:hypothetical protein